MPDGLAGSLSDSHDPLLVPLTAADLDALGLEADIFQSEPNQLASVEASI
jgi:hypothetical protein